jgi:hypothetical protein
MDTEGTYVAGESTAVWAQACTVFDSWEGRWDTACSYYQ